MNVPHYDRFIYRLLDRHGCRLDRLVRISPVLYRLEGRSRASGDDEDFE